jgi:hypothetical protein
MNASPIQTETNKPNNLNIEGTPKMAYGGGKYGGGKFGGKLFGGAKLGGAKYGKSAGDESEPVDSSSEESSEPKMANRGSSVIAAASAMPKKGIRGTYRATGAGRTGAKGDAGSAPEKSAKVAAPKPKASGWKTSVKPAGKGPADYNKDLGDFYLNATSGMFSSKAGGNKGKK